MKKPLIGLALAALLSGCATTSKPAAPVAKAEPLTPLVTDWAAPADYDGMRKQLGWSDQYIARCEQGNPVKAMDEAMMAKQWQQAATLGQNWLPQCPVDMRVQFFTAIALDKLGQGAQSKAHFAWTKGLLDSVMASGNGKTPATALETISVAEEYNTLYLMQLQPKDQALVSGPIMCDRLTATSEDGEQVTLYFNPKAHFARLMKMISEGEK
ncbi:DUF4919 domain-containing protein [Gallaecimonas pentaromativorans]|uniref:Uncharacterized protein DUF4919 n=2 Tax=Gammaproteobacteria TaxID=1236 RepID=A0A3N1NUH5_9GAMM|nr:DUF4919 domain-containing protein [Gallaecimonas pentaromativorans]MED5524962.1 DUF4919 domain-containing protein [Pseudomonadota bacterium]ROQ18858.1 uncharacterized protein DUF4919 [Gallaecimonas pentaromativorans]